MGRARKEEGWIFLNSWVKFNPTSCNTLGYISCSSSTNYPERPVVDQIPTKNHFQESANFMFCKNPAEENYHPFYSSNNDAVYLCVRESHCGTSMAIISYRGEIYVT